jgi:hypothetical protein
MDIIEFRKTHRIRPDCLIFRACLWPEFKDGWPMGHPHHFPTPLHINGDCSLDAFAEDRIGIEYRADIGPNPFKMVPSGLRVITGIHRGSTLRQIMF